MPALTADYYSVEQTIRNALEDQTSTDQIIPGAWGKGRYCATFDMSTVTWAKSEGVGMVTIPAGLIVLGVEILSTITFGTAVISIGSTVSVAKYRAALVFTTPLIQWVPFAVAATLVTQMSTPITAAELIIIENDATAACPTSGIVAVNVRVLEP